MECVEECLKIPQTAYYSLRVPAGAGPYPLLVVLHGFGQVALDFVRVFVPLVEEGILVAAPQAPHHFYTNLAQRQVGFSWLTRYQRDQSVADFAIYMDLLFERLTERYPVEVGKVFVLGFSQGVSMAYRAWLHSRLPVAGIIACAGDLPPDVEQRLPQRDPLPVLLIHGLQDEAVPVERARQAARALERHGYPVHLEEFEGGHVVPSKSLTPIQSLILKEGV